jgi:ubiquinone/menaquinone biosynthesis C-methylase UbiE
MKAATQAPPENRGKGHRIWSAIYDWTARRGGARGFIDPLRREVVGQAHGIVLEIGAGSGLNFPFYVPEQVERVVAVEPDPYMLRRARYRVGTANVPVTLTQAPAEALPFADGVFDTAVATLVFCSVSDPVKAFGEVRRVLKSGGTLLLLEHVRSESGIAAWLQDALTPATTRLSGNCHWNRDTAQSVITSGFRVEQLRRVASGLHPLIMLRARRD